MKADFEFGPQADVGIETDRNSPSFTSASAPARYTLLSDLSSDPSLIRVRLQGLCLLQLVLGIVGITAADVLVAGSGREQMRERVVCR